jgi:hypothetical protein
LARDSPSVTNEESVTAGLRDRRGELWLLRGITSGGDEAYSVLPVTLA